LILWLFLITLIFAMKETVLPGHHTDNYHSNQAPPTLLSARLESLGYQCLSDSCDRFTTLRLVPMEIKRNEEPLPPPSE
jgi:hypothetical protein